MSYPLRFISTVFFVVLLSACAATKSLNTASLSDTLSKQLGVTSTQAQAGVGAILDKSKGQLSPAQFDQVSRAIPGADKYLQSAQNALGGSQVTDLNSAFSKLGMSPDMVNKFKPVVLDYVGKVGGSSTKSLLAGAL